MNTLLHRGGIVPPMRWNRFMRCLGLADDAANQNHILRGYDIVERDDGSGRISLAVPGFGRDELTVERRGPDLVVTGNQTRERRWPDDRVGNVGLLWHGYSQRAFHRTFRLGDDVEIVGSRHENGLLHIDLHRTPEAGTVTRRIPIATPTERHRRVPSLGGLRAWFEGAIGSLSDWWRRTTS